MNQHQLRIVILVEPEHDDLMVNECVQQIIFCMNTGFIASPVYLVSPMLSMELNVSTDFKWVSSLSQVPGLYPSKKDDDHYYLIMYAHMRIYPKDLIAMNALIMKEGHRHQKKTHGWQLFPRRHFQTDIGKNGVTHENILMWITMPWLGVIQLTTGTNTLNTTRRALFSLYARGTNSDIQSLIPDTFQLVHVIPNKRPHLVDDSKRCCSSTPHDCYPFIGGPWKPLPEASIVHGTGAMDERLEEIGFQWMLIVWSVMLAMWLINLMRIGVGRVSLFVYIIYVLYYMLRLAVPMQGRNTNRFLLALAAPFVAPIYYTLMTIMQVGRWFIS